MSDKDWKKEALALVVLLRAKCSDEEWASMESRFAAAPAPQPADLLQTIRYLLMSWSVFYAKLPDGEYDGLGEIRTALANIKDVEVRLAATPQVTPHITRLRPDEEFPKEFAEYDPEGTSEQASPTPEVCPTCGSDSRGWVKVVPIGHPVAIGDFTEKYCPDSWHSGTPKSRDTGISLDGGKTIHSKFKND